jgi:CRP-like cAMP-binding protein
MKAKRNHMFKKEPHYVQYKEFAFADLASTSELEILSRVSTRIDVKEGSVLMRQGSFGNEVLLLVKGQLLIERDGTLIASVSPGSVVGERAVILNEPRGATVRAEKDATILAMTRSEFNTLLSECPSIARNILEEALTRATN